MYLYICFNNSNRSQSFRNCLIESFTESNWTNYGVFCGFLCIVLRGNEKENDKMPLGEHNTHVKYNRLTN